MCQVYDKPSHLANSCFIIWDLLTKNNQGNCFDDTSTAMYASNIDSDDLDNAWLLDSGARHHLTSDAQ